MTRNSSSREANLAIESAAYACLECGGMFTAEEVWDAGGKYICKSCHAKQGVTKGSAEKSAAQTAPAKTARRLRSKPQNLLNKINCPHCWNRFSPEQILWVSQHTELLGDPVLGPDAALRFLPTRFSIEGNALDARGMQCHTMACPKCHLNIPRPLLETEQLFISIVGVPASGKSYFLTAMTWELRRVLPDKFATIYNDADTVTNRALNEYENILFLQTDGTRRVALRKTEVHGVVLYDQIRLGQQVVSLPRPFLFSLRPMPAHPGSQLAGQTSRVLCLYDNAGEAFEPGEDSSTSPVTQHLAKSRVLMFLFDPIQEARFRAQCRELSNDPQLEGPSRRQETVFLEMVARIRRFGGLASNQKFDKPLVIILPKADVWGKLIGWDMEHEPIIDSQERNKSPAMIDTQLVEITSTKIRKLLMATVPEFVTAVEDFSRHVIYIPVSALGRAPERDEDKAGFFVPAGEIRPKWVTVPLLYTVARWAKGLVGAAKSAGSPLHAAASSTMPVSK